MRYLSLFSGIEAATVAWAPLGWECAAVAEIEPFPCSVLAHHYPDVPNLGDVTKITENDIFLLGDIDLVVFGSPCQDLSIAGKRQGFNHDNGNLTRSGLFHYAARIVRWLRKYCGCRFTLWENVLGAFSSNAGEDFAAVVSELSDCAVAVPPKGWGTEGVVVGPKTLVEWCVLDAQWFGVAQRRRRVFALADFGNWSDRLPILLESDRLRGNIAPRREAGKDVARCLTSSAGKRNAVSDPDRGNCVVSHSPEIARCVATREGSSQDYETTTMVAYSLRAEGFDASEDGTGRGTPLVPCSVTLRNRDGGASAELGDNVAFAPRASSGGGDKPHLLGFPSSQSGVRVGAVRRLTPRECERLQGFPDDYTAVPYRKKPAADGPRYKALGNSMAVPVMNWIGRSIDAAMMDVWN